ncbi:MAG: ABC transporter substrate-binding protein [Alphaproteobacteria bacterium]|nr:ABC transporter substrate-binding protein [Alphaproteobacteria bacterium]QQS57367.1 MAG: ABC transporter substrate-binding protein [Alphaproteobacteria bacterium]
MLNKSIPVLGFLAIALLSGTSAQAVTGNMPLQDTSLPSVIAIKAEPDDALSLGSKTLIDEIAKRGIGFLSDKSLTQTKRESEFRKLLNDNFDMETIGRFALGRHWKTATDAQKKEYQKLFNEMIVRVYTARFKEYDGQTLEVKKARKDGTNTDSIVNTVLVPKAGEQAIIIDWRVRQKNGKFKVVDIIVEGVSMALTQRSDFASVIQRGGGDLESLLAMLRKK